MAVVTITTENFAQEVLHSDKPVLLDFWASWCGPCRMLSPIVDEVAEERTDVKVGKVNVDEQPDLAARVRRHEHPHPAAVRERQAGSSGRGRTSQERRAGAAGLRMNGEEPLHGRRCAAAPFCVRLPSTQCGLSVKSFSPFCTNAQKKSYHKDENTVTFTLYNFIKIK